MENGANPNPNETSNGKTKWDYVNPISLAVVYIMSICIGRYSIKLYIQDE